MDPRPVAVIDSGIGGLPYLAWLQEHLPSERLVYVADRKSFPYGEKTPEQVRQSVAEVARQLVERVDPKLLVVACNTASVLALEHLRNVFPGPVVGVVPAVKTAASVTKNGRIGVLATQRTIDGGYLDDLIARFCPDRWVQGWAAGDIVTAVENDYLQPDPAGRARVLSGWAEILLKQHVDTVVLGCTHFLYVTDELQVLLGPDVTLLDSREGVGRRVHALLQEREAFSPGVAFPSQLFYTALPVWDEKVLDSHNRKYAAFARQFHLAFGGVWMAGE